jgi:iron complex transport system ATP-binding protein
MMLTVDGIGFRYNSREVLRDIGFRLERGESLAILGPNGVGKTTLLRCINAILRPHRGTVAVDARDVLRLRPMQIARRIGYVAQKTETARTTAFDAILMGRRPHIRWRASKNDLRLVDGALKLLGLEHLALRYIDQVSGGELQKVAIARALVQEPRLLLFDEPTSSLDLKNQMEILTLIRQVVRQHAVAAVMTMHDLNQALRFADKVLFLKRGRVHFAGRPAAVTAEMVESVYGLPVEIHLYRDYPVVIPVETACGHQPGKDGNKWAVS